MECWFKLSDLQSKIGTIKDKFTADNKIYYDIYCDETKQYYIVLEENVTLIENL